MSDLNSRQPKPGPSLGPIRMLPSATRWQSINWAYYTKTFETDGRIINYVDVGSGEPVVLVHGLGGSWQTWLENLVELSGHMRLIAIDLPGFGASEPLAPGSGFTAFEDTVIDFVEHLGLERAVLVGHSMGGLISVRIAVRRPRWLAALVLVDAGGVAFGRLRLSALVASFMIVNRALSQPWFLRALIARPRLRRLLGRAALGDPSSLHADLAGVILPLLRAPGMLDTLKLAAEAAAQEVDVAAAAVPTLVIWGGRDRLVPPAAGRKLADQLPDGTLVVFPDSGHCPMFEQPAAFSAEVLAFIERLSETSDTT